ncbi:MAG: hypothetical protein JXQ75_01505 [Phycisphaerae bacterium]|nr:hypothetical protein [Phycisphaerae bacterium]
MRSARFVMLLAPMVCLACLPVPGQEWQPTGLEELAGQPADVAPSAYQYHADRRPEENPPESWIGLMKYAGLPFDKAVDVNTPALKKVLYGLIWEEVRRVRRVTLAWNGAARRRPKPEEVVVAYFDAEAKGTIPTWWNTAVTREADKPEVSADGRTYTFTIPVDTFGLVVSVRGQQNASAYEAPKVRAFMPDLWKRMDLEIEWGFDEAAAASDHSGRIEAYDGIVDRVQPLAGDAGTTMEGPDRWRSAPVLDGRRGVSLRLLYLGTSKGRKLWPYNAEPEDVARTIVTVWTSGGNFSFLASDLERGPILAPEYGFFVRASTRPLAARGPVGPTKQTLGEKVDSLPGVPKVRGWAIHGMPWFGVSSANEPGSVGSLTVPARSAAMHPASDQDVAVGWCSPIPGRVSVTGKLAMGDSKGGNGVEWSVVQEGKSRRQVLIRGAIDTGGFQAIPAGADAKKLAEVAVEAGDVLSLVVGAKGGDHICDTTIVELQLAEVGGKERVWSLTKDVVDSVHASNPHDDASGNAAVWHFYASTARWEPPFSLESNARTAKEFMKELAAKGLETTRQRVREHPEQTWDGAVGAMFPGKTLPAIPKPEFETPMKVEVPCRRLAAQWNLGAWHLVRHAVRNDQGQLRFNDHPYGILASETYLVLHALDLMGMHKEAADGLDQWLGFPLRNQKPVGLFSDGDGCLTHAVGPPGVGGNMDGVHAMGPGAIMFALVEHSRLTGDGEWLRANAPRIKANIQWILRQRRLLAGVVPGGDRLWCKGLQPPHQVTPDSGGQLMQFYESEAYYWLAVQGSARILAQIDPAEGARLEAEAESYRKDLKAAVERSIALSPVVWVRDGTYRSFIPFACYVRGFASGAWSWRRPGSGAHVGGLYWDTIQSAEPLVSPAGLLPPDDRRVQGALDVLEDRLLLENPKVAERTPGYDPGEDWFAHAAWQYQPGLERHANIHLAADDAPNFLRSWLNQYAVLILPNEGYTFREHTTGGPPDKIFEEAAFLERFRNMLVMEEGDCLWLGRATPRAWLEQGKRITVQGAPTHFGTVAYRIVSSVDDGKIVATVAMPSRGGQKAVLLRFRHPRAAPIQRVTVNGQVWPQFDRDSEAIRLEGLTGTVAVEAAY